MQAVTVGDVATEYAQKCSTPVCYLYFHGLAVQIAEAEWVHARIRRELGFAGEEPGNLRDILAQRYRGSRYSFGYMSEYSGSVQVAGLLGVIALTCTWMKANSSINSLRLRSLPITARNTSVLNSKGKMGIPNGLFHLLPTQRRLKVAENHLRWVFHLCTIIAGCGLQQQIQLGTPLSNKERPKVL